jgi:Domain of unknown function (DUF4864)
MNPFAWLIPHLRRFSVALLLCGLAPFAAGASGLTQADARAIREVVQGQLDAFAADDAKQAFSFASNAIRTQFGDADNFMAMVRQGYPMVVRPAAVSFFQPKAGEPMKGAPQLVRQDVHLRDAAGSMWIATYALEKESATGSWRIGGCVVRADAARSST